MEQKADKTRKVLVLIGVTIFLIVALPIIIGVGLSLYSLTKTPAPTATPEPNPLTITEGTKWQTYTDKDAGFSIDYPPELYVADKPFQGFTATFLITSLKSLSLSESIAPRIQVYAADMPINTLLKDVNTNRNTDEFPEFSEISLNGYKAYQTSAKDPNIIFSHTIIGDAKKSYLIELFTVEQQNDALKEAYQKMLQSFKIL